MKLLQSLTSRFLKHGVSTIKREIDYCTQLETNV